MYFDLGVEIILSHKILAVMVSEVGMLMTPIYLTILPQTINWVRLSPFYFGAVVYDNATICNIFSEFTWDVIIVDEKRKNH